jgi:hypothetical protein
VNFDGLYHPASEGEGFEAVVKVVAPADGMLIQGVATGPTGITYEVKMHLPPKFFEKEYIEISTPLGPVNAKFKRLRRLI